MRSLPLALVLSIALWAFIVELVVGLSTVVGGPSAVTVLADITAAAPTLMAAAMP